MKKEKTRIVASLEFGAVYSGGFLALAYILLTIIVALSVFLVIITICNSSITVPIEETERVILSFFFCAISLCIAMIIIMIHRQWRKVRKWREDAVELFAYSTTIENMHVNSFIFPIKTSKILVKFKHDGRVIKRISGKKDGSMSGVQGYSKIFRKYADREIRILYSPKYDQVLLLKDEKKRKKRKETE